MPVCNRHLTSIQRRSMQMFGGNLTLVVALTVVARMAREQGHLADAVFYLLAILPAIPVVAIVAIVGRYLARETDEFIRLMVMKSVLWGFGFTMILDTVLGGLFPSASPLGGLLPILNIDLFCIVAMIALRVQLWRNQ